MLILLSVSSVFVWLLTKGIKARKTSAWASGELAPLQLAAKLSLVQNLDFFFSLAYLPLEPICSPHIPSKPVILEVGKEHDSENNL